MTRQRLVTLAQAATLAGWLVVASGRAQSSEPNPSAPNPSAQGWVFQVDSSATLGGFVASTVGSEPPRRRFETWATTLGSMLSVNLGYAPDPELRFGLAASIGGEGALEGGDDIPTVTLSPLAHWSIGPRARFRVPETPMFEVEGGLSFTQVAILGTGIDTGDPSGVSYPLMEIHQGAQASAMLFCRPWGPTNPFSVHVGARAGMLFASRQSNLFPIASVVGVSWGY